VSEHYFPRGVAKTPLGIVTLIDTSAWIEYLRATGSDADYGTYRLLKDGQAAWCEIVVLELLNGVGAQEAARVQRLRPSVWVLEIDSGVWSLARKLITNARRSALTVPLPDLIIAACARSYEIQVLHHGDAHFAALAKVEL
jgi:predicted nucleic acid-binding protein